jgi:long-chain fatty acid transport protein
MKVTSILALLTLLLGSTAFATDGYFSIGCGTMQVGQGGAGVAFPEDSLAGGINPAGMVLVGNRFDLGLALFRPIRSGSITGSGAPVNGSYDASRLKDFLSPELGFNHLANPRLSLGVSICGNGGMDTSYTTSIPLLGNSRAGVDLEQLFVSPTVAFKVTEHQALGIAANVAWQRFSALGLENFTQPGFSIDPADLTNRGFDEAYGAGFRVGWVGEFGRFFNLGATFQSRTYMQKFDKYRGLFAEQGGFDIPANVAGGVALKPTRKATVVLDVERIFYGQVKSLANLDSSQAQLGANNGPGFGWHDITAVKTGINYKVAPSLTLRGGYNHSGVPFNSSQTFFNLLAPAVVQHHLTAGATLALSNDKEVNVAYQHAFQNTVNGASSIAPAFGGGEANLTIYQNAISLSFGWGGKE